MKSVILDLTGWVRAFAGKNIYEIKIQDLYISPSGQKALVQIKTIYQKDVDIDVINRIIANFNMPVNAS